MAHKIGTYTLAAQHDFNRGQEFAGATYTVRVEPGEYPITVERGLYGERYVAIRMPGICVLDSWVGTNVRISRPMTPDVHVWTAHSVGGLLSYGCPPGGPSAINLDAHVMREYAARKVCSTRRVLERYIETKDEPEMKRWSAMLDESIALARSCGALPVCHAGTCENCKSRLATTTTEQAVTL